MTAPPALAPHAALLPPDARARLLARQAVLIAAEEYERAQHAEALAAAATGRARTILAVAEDRLESILSGDRA